MGEILRIDNISKSFDGRPVFTNVTFAVQEGELSSIIGPNGAGKTTMFNLITGFLTPDSGAVVFQGRDISGMEPFDIVRLGMARAFQRTNIFPRMTVLENMLTAVISRERGNLNFITPISKKKRARDRAFEILHGVGLADMASRQSGSLPHGDQKRLDIAVALALEPSMLLLDEPTAGMSPDERRQTMDFVRDLWERLKITMLFIEHDMDIVFGISQRVRVLCYRSILAEGTPAEISANEQVIEAYLGEEV
jgi:branched-chain amino acid transport system ATP-binding protein